MQGLILVEFERFFRQRFGDDAWFILLERAGVSHHRFHESENYPDGEVLRLVLTGGEMTHTPVHELLEHYGEFIAPRLLERYRGHLKPGWKTLDVIANTEAAIHTTVRAADPKADPPRLRTLRLSPDEVTLAYASPRRLCGVARGIGRGIARHFGEELSIREPSCMHRGDPACIISFRVLPRNE